jgi:hypothetical protein
MRCDTAEERLTTHSCHSERQITINHCRFQCHRRCCVLLLHAAACCRRRRRHCRRRRRACLAESEGRENAHDQTPAVDYTNHQSVTSMQAAFLRRSASQPPCMLHAAAARQPSCSRRQQPPAMRRSAASHSSAAPRQSSVFFLPLRQRYVLRSGPGQRA